MPAEDVLLQGNFAFYIYKVYRWLSRNGYCFFYISNEFIFQFSCYSPSFVDGRQWKCVICRRYSKGNKVSWHCPQRSPRNVLLNIVHPSCPLGLNLQLGSLGEGVGVINWFGWSEIYFWCFENLFQVPVGVVMHLSPCLLWWLFPQTGLVFISFSQDQTASSTFQLPVCSLGTELETETSW